ncbi:MAG: hypothetical protein PWQ97_447 [Tepidanaerobacteraceae bacterium]|nr:hypothetical protein [Tepidanaerobacteraceae bacterium]
MITAIKNAVKDTLNTLGIKNIYTEEEDASKHHASPYALMIKDPDEELVYDGSRVAYEINGNIKKVRIRIYQRTVRYRIVVSSKDPENILNQLLANLKNLYDPQGNYISVYFEGIHPKNDPSVLRGDTIMEMLVSFAGGVYQDKEYPLVNINNIEIQMENGG